MRKLKLEDLGRLSVSEFKSADKIRISILLDNVRSMHNVGSAFRTSDAFLIEKIYLGGITATPPHRDIRKTALGAEETVDWEHSSDSVSLIREHRQLGYKIVVIEQTDASMPLQEFDISKDQKYLIIFGNEINGVDDEIIALCDHCLEIPQFGSKHSLNVSVSIGICLWEFVRQFHLH